MGEVTRSKDMDVAGVEEEEEMELGITKW